MNKFSLKSKVFFTKRLAFLMEAEVPLLEALVMLREQAGSAAQQHIIGNIAEDVARGRSLAKSLEKFPGFFRGADIALITVGELSGTLRQNLAYLGAELEKREKARGKIVAALIYPFVVLSAALSIIAFLLLYLFPKIVPVFLSLHKELPLSTRVVIAVSGFLKEWWLFLGGGIFLLALGAVFLMRKNPNARRARDYVLVRVPFLGRLVREQILAQSMRTLGLLLKSGVALPESLDATAAAVQNCAYRESFETFASRARHGERIADAFKEEPFLFPEICAQMTAVGERSGNLSESFLYLSDLYERETEESLARFSGALEPALMVSMGLMVGFIAISIITPIYGITQNLHP